MLLPRLCVHVLHRWPSRGEDPKERVVVRLTDGVELVVVTARARDRLRQEGLAEDVDGVIREADLLIQGVRGREAVEDEAPMSRADSGLVDALLLVDPGLGEQVPRHVLARELVIRHVLVEGADQVVAVLKGVRDRRVTLRAVRVRIAHEVHPVPRPALAIARRGEEPVDDALEGALPLVQKEGCELLCRRREARERVAEATDERATVRRRRGREALLREAASDEVIDGVPSALGDGRSIDRLKAPPLLALLELGLPRGERHELPFRERRVARVQRAVTDPLFEVSDDCVVELAAVFRHLEPVELVTHDLEDEALPRFARDDRRP